MAYKAGTVAFLKLDSAAGALVDLSAYTDTHDFTTGRAMLDVTSFGTSAEVFISGVAQGQVFPIGGAYDAAVFGHFGSLLAAQDAATWLERLAAAPLLASVGSAKLLIEVRDLATLRLGWQTEPTSWLLKPRWAFAAICLTIIWKTSSFMALILLAGLQMIPKSLYEAAEVDGASKWQQFWQITIPMLTPSIIVALIFRTITALQTFDIPYTMTKGGPGNATETLAMLIHKTTIDYLDVGYGSTLAVCMFVLSMVITAFYLRRVGASAS